MTFTEFLENSFNAEREYGGIPITKENCEDLFENWLADKDHQEIIDLADLWGNGIEERLVKNAQFISSNPN